MAKVALQMDALASIKPKGDSTLRIGLEAQARGHELYYYTPDTLSNRDGTITAKGHRVKLFADLKHYYELRDALTINLTDMDVVLLRQDPPFHMTYLTTTYLLEMLPSSTLVVNDPASVRNHPEKLFPTLLRQYMPETLITADRAEIERFWRDHKDIIMKPL
jgi:glutathione synthase